MSAGASEVDFTFHGGPALQVMSVGAFQTTQLGSALSKTRARPFACGLRMQAEVENSEEVVDDAPKLSRAQRRLQEKYNKKNTDGTTKATQQVAALLQSIVNSLATTLLMSM